MLTWKESDSSSSSRNVSITKHLAVFIYASTKARQREMEERKQHKGQARLDEGRSVVFVYNSTRQEREMEERTQKRTSWPDKGA